MKNARSIFCQSLAKFSDALTNGRYEEAMAAAESFYLAAEMMTIEPRFLKRIERRCPGADPRQMLRHMCDFLVCVTEAQTDEPLRPVVLPYEKKKSAPKK